MASEQQVQRMIIDHFISSLGYEEKKSQTIYKGLVIKDDLLRILTSPRNINSFKKIVKDEFNNDESSFMNEFCEFVIDECFSERINTALFLQKQKIKFKSEIFTLFFPHGSPGGQCHFHENIFSIAEELVYQPNLPYPHKKFNRRPDLVFYVNGLYFSMMELKHLFQRQDAKHHGREKVISNYRELVEAFAPEEMKEPELTRDEIKAKNVVLSLYENAVHIASCDLKSTFLIRNTYEYRSFIQSLITEGSHDQSKLFNKFEDDFQEYPNKATGTDKDRFVVMANNLYSKTAIENEILFYNYVEKNVDMIESVEQGKQVLHNRAKRRISPRPKQKFGADETIRRVRDLYLSEKKPSFIEYEYRSKLQAMGMSSATIDKEVALRMQLTNNTNSYSILKQYAAGFGKTKLMSWEAAQMIEMHHPKEGGYLFGKVILVSDRLDLRDQMTNTFYNMPTIKRGLWKEAHDTPSFMDALLDDTCRILMVNIQKFISLEKRLTKSEKETLSKLRIAFIIDEIHRSNDGKQNDNMMEMFQNLKNSSDNKNLIVGLTATAKDKTLQRFGEVAGQSQSGLVFEPFDHFSMLDAIKGGFVLDPMKVFIPIHQPVLIDDSKIGEGYKMPSSDDFYNDHGKIKKVVSKSMECLKDVTFKSVRVKGKGSLAKAMYVGHSIDAAIMAFHEFKKEINNLYEDTDSHKPEVYIVFSKSNDQRHRATPESLNGGLSEKKAISAFKQAKNSIIVVVDKLQTGFDEPSLHTLILNTERKDVTMVQTLCRINRTMKGKRNCMVLDFSMVAKNGKTKNEMNAQDAFLKYAGMNTSVINLQQSGQDIYNYHDDLKSDYAFENLYGDYLKSLGDADYETTVFNEKVKSMDTDRFKDLFEKSREFFSSVELLRGILSLDSKIISTADDQRLKNFLSTLRSILSDPNDTKTTLGFEFLDIQGVTIDDFESAGAEGLVKRGQAKKSPVDDEEENSDPTKSLLKAVMAHNEFHEIQEASIEAFLGLINDLLIFTKDMDTSKQLNNKIKSDPTGNHQGDFEKLLDRAYRSFKRRKSASQSVPKERMELLKKVSKDLAGNFYQNYLKMF